jgi:hypothetical protein
MDSKPDNDNRTSAVPAGRRRWLWLPALAVILALALLISIPYGITWVLKDWLLENGAGQVEINDIDFNPFTGIASVELLNISVDERNTLVIPHLMLEVNWSPFLDRRIHVKTVVVDGVNVLIEQDADGEITMGGISINDTGPEETPGEPWDYGVIELVIRNSVIDYRTPDLQLKTGIQELALTELATWLTRPAPLVATGELNGAGFEIDGELPSLEDGYGYSGSLKVTGLPLATFDAMAQPAISGLAGRLTLDTRLELKQLHGQPVQAQQEGLIRLDDLQFVQAENSLSNKLLQWQGSIDLTLADAVTIRTRGVITSDDLVFDMPGEGVNLQQGKLVWDGSVDYADTESGGLQVAGKLELEQTRLDPRDKDLRLVHFGKLAIESIRVQGVDRITIENLAIADVVFAQALTGADAPEGKDREPPPLKIASLGFDKIEVTDGKRVSIDTILSDHATYVARRNKGGEWRMATILGSLPFADDDEETLEAVGQQAPDDEATSIRVGVIKNTNATLTLEDNSVSPAFQTRFNMLAVTRDIDSAKPDQDTHVYLQGNIAKHNKVEIKGTVRPFAETLSMNLEAHIEGLEMPPYSPYAIDAIGHRLDSGQLDADSTLVLDKGKLDGMNNLTLRSLVLSPVESKSLDKMEIHLAVPLNKALDMLRDEHDVIRLKLPITGDLDNPNFDASDAINQAVARATREGVITSLTLLLQPYGSLVTVARYAAEKAAEIKLDPVVFTPASADIDAAHHDYLDKVAGIIKQRPNVNVRLCGVATAADRVALQEQALVADKDKKKSQQQAPANDDRQLIDLADRRDATIKDYFIDKHGVKPGRLVACKPVIDAAEGAEPRVDLLI